MTAQENGAAPTRRRWMVGIIIAIVAIAIGAGVAVGLSAQGNSAGTDKSGSVVHNGGDMCGQVTCDEFKKAATENGQ